MQLGINPDIANAFFRAGEIEAWGHGIDRIFIACGAAGVRAPDLRLEGSGLWTEFSFSGDYLKKARMTPKVTPKANHPKAASKLKKPSSVTPEMTPEMTPEKSFDTAKSILTLLRGQPTLTAADVARILVRSRSTVLRAIRKLREDGRLRYVGPRKGGFWEIN